MFGKHGLAIIALQDDVAFASRIFNSSHIDLDIYQNNEELEKDAGYFKGVVISGTAENEDLSREELSLSSKARDTFLRKESRYPFIGIIRLKVDERLLRGKGLKLIWAIKSAINDLVNVRTANTYLNSIVIDSYDSDELTVVGFSNGIESLSRFYSSIRRMHTSILPGMEDCNKHVFAACYASFGYDIALDFTKESQEKFLHYRQEEKYWVNVLCETKPGHRKRFCDFFESVFKGKDLEKTISGGSIVISRLQFNEIEVLCDLIRESKSEFRNHLIRIKLTLGGKELDLAEPDTWMHTELPKEECQIEMSKKWALKSKLTRLGVSKIERERFLSLFDLYNDCENNRLQRSFFHSLLPSVILFGDVIVDDIAKDSESLSKIETIIGDEVTALECAMYNRMHNKMTPNAVLEYCGGVQQYIQALEYAYRKLVQVMAPERAKSQYICITGSELVSSTATHFEMNINHIIYPQLFATIAWKEAANFAAILSLKFDSNRTPLHDIEQAIRAIETFQQFMKSPESALKLQAILMEDVSFVSNESLRSEICLAINEKLLNYAINDFVVFHFSFQRDFELMWHFYWSIFLQTASTYRRTNEIRRRKFVMFLLRLCIVALLDIDDYGNSKWELFLKTHITNPFDYAIAPLWLSCYDRVLESAKSLLRTLDSFNIHDALYAMIYLHETSLSSETEDMDVDDLMMSALKDRGKEIERLESLFKKGAMICSDSFKIDHCDSEHVICLMTAYLRVIRELSSEEKKMRSIPRIEDDLFIKQNGHDHNLSALRDNFSNAARILSEPNGGFFCLTPDIRRNYFRYNTIFFRALWDLSYSSKKNE